MPCDHPTSTLKRRERDGRKLVECLNPIGDYLCGFYRWADETEFRAGPLPTIKRAERAKETRTLESEKPKRYPICGADALGWLTTYIDMDPTEREMARAGLDAIDARSDGE